jgi:pimeloyl-ACP methyl ester carboxylesterase
MKVAYSRTGAGAPLVLLHPLGFHRGAWDPVIPTLAESFDVIAVDLPGFGDSPPLAGEPTPARLARAVAGLLDELGVVEPHVAGNSLGGWVALELATIRPVASLALLSPAGLWRRATPRYARVTLRLTRWMAVHLTGGLCRLMRYRLGRLLVLGQTHGRPTHASPAYARAAIRAMGTAPGFDAVFAATLDRRYLGGAALEVPLALAWGTRDRLLLKHQSRHLDQLPPGTRIEPLPRCGHVPMTDDPQAVAAFVAGSAASAAFAGQRRPRAATLGSGDGA